MVGTIRRFLIVASLLFTVALLNACTTYTNLQIYKASYYIGAEASKKDTTKPKIVKKVLMRGAHESK